jgi:hypothetical protein
VVAGLLAIGLLGAAGPSRQRPQSKDEVLHAYEELVAKYQAGDDAAVKALEMWTGRQTETAVTRIDHDKDEWRPWTAAQRIAAAMLHTDVAVRRFAVSDKQAVQLHLGLAGDLLLDGSEQTKSEREAFAGQWFAAAGRWLRQADPVLAEYTLERGRKRLPDTAGLLYQSALLATDKAVAYDNLARAMRDEPYPRHGGLASSVVDLRRERLLKQMPTETRAALGQADGWLSDALRLAPADEAIRLHHAYVRLLGGHERDAIEDAKAVQQQTHDPRLAYLAALLAGAASEGQHVFAGAAGFYRAATLTWPRGQHAYIALSEALARQGMRAKAVEVLQDFLTGPRHGAFDEPWWDFVVGPSSDTDPFADLRNEARP